MSIFPPVRAAVLCLLAAGLCQAASKVEVGEGPQRIPLPYVEGTRFAKTDGSSVVTLLFSEKAPQNVTLVDGFGNEDLSLASWMATTGEAVAVKISFVEGDEENYSMTIYLGPETVPVGAHESGTGVRGAFRKLDLKPDQISGTLERKQQPGILSGTFDTKLTVLNEPQWISGAAVLKSPQGQALLAYASAMRKFDYKGATRYSVRDEAAETRRTIDMMGEARMKDLIRAEFGTAKDFEKLLGSADASMAEAGNSTKIRLVKRQADFSETSTIGLVKVDGSWKVNW
jgi:hypothetical protein